MSPVRPLTAAALGAALAGALLAAAPTARAQEAPFSATTLAVTADGEVRAAPDIAVLNVGVTSQGATAAEAVAAMRGQMSATTAALKGAGVAAADVQTSGLSLNPQYDEGPNRPRRLTGYEASNQVTVTVREVGRTGAVLDAALDRGANTVNGVSFDLADRTPAEDAARRAAVKALGDKARLYAEAAGLHVKRLVSLREGGEAPQPMFRSMVSEVVVTGSRIRRTPVEPGQLRIRETASAVYELER